MQHPDSKPVLNRFYKLALLSGFCFIVTILASIALLFGDNSAPVARWFNRYGNVILIVEVIALIICGLTGMAYDQGPVTTQEADLTTDDPTSSEPAVAPDQVQKTITNKTGREA